MVINLVIYKPILGATYLLCTYVAKIYKNIKPNKDQNHCSNVQIYINSQMAFINPLGILFKLPLFSIFVIIEAAYMKINKLAHINKMVRVEIFVFLWIGFSSNLLDFSLFFLLQFCIIFN